MWSRGTDYQPISGLEDHGAYDPAAPFPEDDASQRCVGAIARGSAPPASITRRPCSLGLSAYRRKSNFRHLLPVLAALLVGMLSGGTIVGTYVNRLSLDAKVAHEKVQTELMAVRMRLVADDCNTVSPSPVVASPVVRIVADALSRFCPARAPARFASGGASACLPAGPIGLCRCTDDYVRYVL
jgi:hypothetical protein